MIVTAIVLHDVMHNYFCKVTQICDFEIQDCDMHAGSMYTVQTCNACSLICTCSIFHIQTVYFLLVKMLMSKGHARTTQAMTPLITGAPMPLLTAMQMQFVETTKGSGYTEY